MAEELVQKAIQIFRENQGTLRFSEAVRLGIPVHTIYQMFAKGIIAREARGEYYLAKEDIPFPNELVSVCKRIPKAVICLISALAFYDLTTQIPYAIYIALPQEIRAPRLKYPPLNIVWLSTKAYAAGIEEKVLDTGTIRIYSMEKTIADCFKFRNKVGDDATIEALRDYRRKFRPRIDKLLEYARINRVEKRMRPYLEAIL